MFTRTSRFVYKNWPFLFLLLFPVYLVYAPVAFISPTTPVVFEDGEYPKVTGRFSGTKFRDCTRVPFSEVGFKKNIHGVSSEVLSFRYVKDKTPEDSKPTGKFDFGKWEWRVKSKPDSVYLVLNHKCFFDLVTVQTKLGPFKVN